MCPTNNPANKISNETTSKISGTVTGEIGSTAVNKIRKLTELAKAGDVKAQFTLGNIFIKEKNYEEGIKWLKKAGRQGHEGAPNRLYSLVAEKDNKEAVTALEYLAKKNNAMAQFYLGGMYITGQGGKKDDKAGFDLLKKSVENGCDDALSAIKTWAEYRNFYALSALAYLADKEDPFAKGILKKYEDIAFGQYVDHQVYLGRIYEEGIGVKKNHEKAVFWYSIAAVQNDIQALTAITNLAKKGDRHASQMKQRLKSQGLWH